MNILISGGTGFIGSKLIEKLVSERHHIYVLTRFSKQHPDSELISYISYHYPMKKLPFIHAVINLAGESLYGYWTKQKKTAIIESRINTTEKLIELIKQMNVLPNVFITGSAVGFYGMSNEMIFTENSESIASNDDFLSEVTHAWENTAQIIEDFGVRTVYARFGVVLAKEAGALPLMALPIKLFAGGKIGDGKQWISWIHLEDCINLLDFALKNNDIRGALNITAPRPQQNRQFTKTLAKTLQRPYFITTPKPIIKTALGGMHQLITDGQYVLPQKALKNGFQFNYPHLHQALDNIYR